MTRDAHGTVPAAQPSIHAPRACAAPHWHISDLPQTAPEPRTHSPQATPSGHALGPRPQATPSWAVTHHLHRLTARAATRPSDTRCGRAVPRITTATTTASRPRYLVTSLHSCSSVRPRPLPVENERERGEKERARWCGSFKEVVADILHVQEGRGVVSSAGDVPGYTVCTRRKLYSAILPLPLPLRRGQPDLTLVAPRHPRLTSSPTKKYGQYEA